MTQNKKDLQASAKDLSALGKTALLAVMLSRPEGASVKEMADTLHWLENSVRGAMYFLAKHTDDYELKKEKIDGLTRYRFVEVENKALSQQSETIQ